MSFLSFSTYLSLRGPCRRANLIFEPLQDVISYANSTDELFFNPFTAIGIEQSEEKMYTRFKRRLILNTARSSDAYIILKKK